MAVLKGGAVAQDPRLGRIPQFDPLSAGFRIRALPQVQNRRPRSYTWRPGAPLDQGREGSCVGHAFAADLPARPRVVPADHDVAMAIYHRAQVLDAWPGGAYPGAWPRYEGTSVLAGAKACTEAGHYLEYRWAFTEEEIALAVGFRGPVILGVNWYAGMHRPNPAGYIEPTGALLGGHAILAFGVNIPGGYYRLINSWSASWGQAGTCRISRQDVARLLSEDGEACLPVRR